MWQWVLKAVLAVSSNPAVRQWAKRKARSVIDRIRNRADRQIEKLEGAAGLEAAPRPKLSRLIRTDKDILRPGQVAVVDGKAYRVTRLLSSNAKETVYEAVEA